MQADEQDPYEFEQAVPHWTCQSCGFEDYKKALPKDRDKYYRNPWAGKCPKCKSEDMSPQGW